MTPFVEGFRRETVVAMGAVERALEVARRRAGHNKGDVLGHVLQVNGDKFLPIDKTLIPTAELRPVKGTVMDFTRPETFGKRIRAEDEQLKLGLAWIIHEHTH